MIPDTKIPNRLINYLFIFFLLIVFLVPIRSSFALPSSLEDEKTISKGANKSSARESVENCGRAIELDGIDDWINIPDLILANDFTIEGWVKIAPAIESDDALFGQEGSGLDVNFYLGKARLFDYADKITSETAFLPDTWGHIALTRSGKNLTLYVNGVEDAKGTWEAPLSLKSIGWGNRGFFKGMLDEIRVWNIARTKADIGASFNLGVEPNSFGLIGYWHFNETGQSVTDASSSANHGSLGVNTIDGIDDPTRIGSTAPLRESCNGGKIGGNKKAAPVANFMVMQSLLFDEKKPSNDVFLSHYNIGYLPEFGHGFENNWNVSGGANPFYDPPSEELVKKWAKNTTSDFGFIDIQHLPVAFGDEWDDDWVATTPLVKINNTDRERAIKEMSLIADWAHEANPKLKIGYFGVLPQREYWAFITPAKMAERLKNLKQRNEKFKQLANHVDAIFPTLYTFYNEPNEWKIYAKSMFEEARQYNKPVFAVIWPLFHTSNKTVGGKFIGGDFWRIQLEHIYELGYDGVVIWGGSKEKWDVSASDTDPGNWWFQTLAFMHSKGLLPKGAFGKLQAKARKSISKKQ